MKMKYVRKLIIGSTALAFTAATLITTTYAWVSIRSVSEVKEFQFTADTAFGLQVSLDGDNYTQDITLADLKSKITENRSKNVTTATYDSAYMPVTPKITNGEIELDSDGYPVFERDETYNLVVGGVDNRTQNQKANEIFYGHRMTTADVSDYLMFDVWFKISSDNTDHGTYKLFFENTKADTGTAIGLSGGSTTVTLSNNMTTIVNNTVTNYANGDAVSFKPVDAMRLGVVNHSETTKKLTVYEESIGLGSMAIEGATDQEHAPSLNAMYTYYNSLDSRKAFESAAASGYTTKSSYQQDAIHTFNYNNGYDAVKMTFVIWLEGWDADYFAGITNTATYRPSDFKVNLGFELKKQ